MAGIQFDLEDYFQKDTFSEALYKEAILISESVGSWWLTIIYLFSLIWIIKLPISEATKFYSMISFSVVISIVITSIINVLVGKTVSENLFLGIYHTITSFLISAFTLSTIISAILSSLLIYISKNSDIFIKIEFVLLTISFSSIWIVSNFISIVKREKVLFFAYLISFLFSLSLSFISSNTNLSFALLQLIISLSLISFFLFFYLIKSYQRGKIAPSWEFLKNLKFFSLYLAPYFFSLGIWIDKIIYWFHPKTTHKIDLLFRFSNYDKIFFLSFSIFSLAQILIYRRFQKLISFPYQEFINMLIYNGTFLELQTKKRELIAGYRTIFLYICYFYTLICFIIYFVLYYFYKMEIKSLQPVLYGTFFLGILSLNYLVLQLLNKYDLLAISTFAFFSLNWILTIYILQKNVIFWGLGFCVGSILGALLSSFFIHQILSRWEYLIFRGENR